MAAKQSHESTTYIRRAGWNTTPPYFSFASLRFEGVCIDLVDCFHELGSSYGPSVDCGILTCSWLNFSSLESQPGLYALKKPQSVCLPWRLQAKLFNKEDVYLSIWPKKSQRSKESWGGLGRDAVRDRNPYRFITLHSTSFARTLCQTLCPSSCQRSSSPSSSASLLSLLSSRRSWIFFFSFRHRLLPPSSSSQRPQMPLTVFQSPTLSLSPSTFSQLPPAYLCDLATIAPTPLLVFLIPSDPLRILQTSLRNLSKG